MYTCYVLIENFHSEEHVLRFDKFRLWTLRQGDFDGLIRLRKLFPSMALDFTYWVYERSYPDDLRRDAMGYGRIPFDVEDTLLLLRLFKAGDLTFSRVGISNPNGTFTDQMPYRAMASFPSTSEFRLARGEVGEWERFAHELLGRDACNSVWFRTARKFFLYGAAKELNLDWLEVDRIVDFMTALEATLVTENDFVGRRLRERAASLLGQIDQEATQTKRLIRDFYSMRSTIVHGAALSEHQMRELQQRGDFESIVRQILVAALRQLPSDENERAQLLGQLFDVTDDVRSDAIFQDFKSISDDARRQLLIRMNG